MQNSYSTPKTQEAQDVISISSTQNL